MVLIAAPDVLPALKQQVGGGEVLSFSDAEAVRALEAIVRRKPPIVALDRLFAATPRGAALINRIKADPSLTACEIQIVSLDGNHTRPAARRGDADPGGGTAVAAAPAPAPAAAAAVAAARPSPASPAQPLDQRGTRRAPRFAIVGDPPVLVDGNQAVLVNLSVIGAQVVSASVLKPNQRVRIALYDDNGTVRFNASVAWASFEIPAKSGPRYRAGLEFIDANAAAVDEYCTRHKG